MSDQMDTPKPRTAYDKIRRAYENNTGTRLTADDVFVLMSDTAIKDVVLGTWVDEE
jgi:hypothetical protein